MGARLVGRDRELGALVSLLDDVSVARGRAIVVLGEAGIGKTALLEALVDVADGRGIPAAWGRCTASEAPAYWPWRQLLRGLGDNIATGTLETPTVDIPRAELFARVVEELASLPGSAVLALEDIHWADAASLALLRFVVDALPSLPLLVVATTRDDPLDMTPEVSDLLRALPAGVARILLGGLDPAAVAEVVAGDLGHEPDAALVARIFERSGGNPFFVHEVSRLHASRGPAATPQVPPGVQQVLERRLARLSQPCAELLTVAAVADDLDPALLAAVVGHPVSQVGTLLAEAADARLVIGDAPELRFAHALIREVLAAQLPATRRGDLHRRVAESLEQRLAGDPTDDGAALGRLVMHWRRAPGDDGRRIAAQRSLAAARDARKRLGYEQAARYYAWALEDPPEDELGIRIELGEAQILAGSLLTGRATLREAARMARRRGKPRELARAVLGLGGGIGGFEVDVTDDEQISLLQQALTGLEAASRRADDALRAAVMARLSLAPGWLGSEEERVALAEEAIKLARAVGDARTEVAALAAWCDARASADHTDERLVRADEMITAAERSDDPVSLLLARRFRIVALAERGDFAGFDAEVAAYAQTATRLMLPLYSWLVPLWRGLRALMQGDVAAVEHHLARMEELGDQAGSINAVLMGMVQRFWLARYMGAGERMTELAGRIEKLLGAHPDLDALWAAGLAHAGQLEQARGYVRGCIVGAFTFPQDAEYLASLGLLTEALTLIDEPDAAERAYDALEPYADCWVIDGIGAVCMGVTAHYLGRLAAALGRYEQARGWLEAALTAHREADASLLVAQTEAALAELAAVEGSRTPPALAASPEEAIFRRSGKVWQVRWRGVEATVAHAKGMRDLAVLLAAPNRDVHVLDLVEATGGQARATAGGHAGERLDQQARTAYRRRLEELEAELAEAEAHTDVGRVAALREEQQFLAAELAGALGIGGRARTAGDPAERARTAVTNRIRNACKAIAEVHPELGIHLDRSIRTGRFCAYRPEQAVTWQT